MLKWFRKESDAKTLEKELASIAAKITAYETTLASLRAAHRRYKGALTLYLILFYTIYLAGWFLFIARRAPKDLHWLLETLPTVAGPFVIAGLRYILSAYYNRRIASNDAVLAEQRSLQHEKIEAFKARTDFYSTKSLIDRYSGNESPKAPSQATTPTKGKSKLASESTPRSAQDKPGKAENSFVNSPASKTPASLKGTVPTPSHLSGIKATPRSSSESVHPADGHAQQHDIPDLRAIPAPHHWYDRILDVVIGEDESATSSRYQLEQRLLKKEEEVRRLEVEMVKMQQALQERSASPIATDPIPEKEGSTARDETGKADIRVRRTSRRLESKAQTQDEASDDDEEQ